MVRDNEIDQLRKLVLAWESGDEIAGGIFYGKIKPTVRTFAKKNAYESLRIRLDVCDYCQIVYMRLAAMANKGELAEKAFENSFFGWLRTFVGNNSSRENRNHHAPKRDFRRQVSADAENFHGSLPDPNRTDDQFSAREFSTEKLKPRDARIFELRIQGYSQREIAKRENVNERTVRRSYAASNEAARKFFNVQTHIGDGSQRKICPVCEKTSYSSAGIHPQCAAKRDRAEKIQTSN